MSVVDIEDFKREQRRRERKEAMEDCFRHISDYCYNNRQTLIETVPVIIGGLVMARKYRKAQDMKRLKERMIYDRKKGHYIETKRKLKSSEWIEFDRRVDNGERPADILKDMGLLKR